MDFGEALRALKTGKRVARAGWNGKGMWLALVEPHSPLDLSALTGVAPLPAPMRWWYMGVPGDARKILPWIGMRTADESFVPWLASQTDLLADDWSEA